LVLKLANLQRNAGRVDPVALFVLQCSEQRVGAGLLRAASVRERLLLRTRGPADRRGGAAAEGRGRARQLCLLVSAGQVHPTRRDRMDRAADTFSADRRRRRQGVRQAQVGMSPPRGHCRTPEMRFRQRRQCCSGPRVLVPTQ